MRPLAAPAGVILGLAAMGIAHGQSLTDGAKTALAIAPLSVVAEPGFVRQQTMASGPNLIQQNTSQISRRTDGGAIDTFRVTGVQSGPASFVYAGNIAQDVDYSRSWPAAVRTTAGSLAIEVSPEAGLGYGSAGSSLSGGATLRVGSETDDRQGVYLFAAAKGRAVGLNMGGQGWKDDTAAVVGDAQLGLGWTKGAMQTSLGYVVRKVRIRDDYARRFLDTPSTEQIAGISVSYRPKR